MLSTTKRRDSEQELEEGEIGDDSEKTECQSRQGGTPLNLTSAGAVPDYKTSILKVEPEKIGKGSSPNNLCGDNRTKKKRTCKRRRKRNVIRPNSCNRTNDGANVSRHRFSRPNKRYPINTTPSRPWHHSNNAKSKECAISPQLKSEKSYNSPIQNNLMRKPSFCSEHHNVRPSSPSHFHYKNAISNNSKTAVVPKLHCAAVPSKYIGSRRGRSPNMGRKVEHYLVDNEASYDELLEQYKSIKAQLANLNSKKGQNQKGNTHDGSSRADSKSSLRSDVGFDKENRHDKGQASSRRKRRKSSTSDTGRSNISVNTTKDRQNRHSSGNIKSKLSGGGENASSRNNTANAEDEEDEAELRRIALASASRKRVEQRVFASRPNATESGIEHNVAREKQNGIYNILGDNYEMVEMDLGSEDEVSHSGTRDGFASHAAVSDDEDLNEDELRELLLRSLACRKNEKKCQDQCAQQVQVISSPPAPERKVLLPAQENEVSKPLVEIPKDALSLKPPQQCLIPRLEPVIINLAEDSSSDESADEACKHNEDKKALLSDTNDDAIAAGVDKFLKDARLKSAADSATSHKTILQNNGTPLAVYQLSKAQQLEYRKLKAEIARREMKRKADPTAEISEAVDIADKKQKLVQTEHQLQTHRMQLKLEQQKLIGLKSKVIGKKATQRKVQMQLQQLKEQLAATEKLLNTTTETIGKFNLEMRQVQTNIDKEMAQIIDLEKQCSGLGVSVHGSSYQVPTQTGKSPTKRKISFNSSHFSNKKFKLTVNTMTSPRKLISLKNTQSSSSLASNNLQQLEEKKRLQILERLLSQKLSDLRKKSGVQIGNADALSPSSSPVKKSSSALNKPVPPNTRRVACAKFWIAPSASPVKNAISVKNNDKTTEETSKSALPDSLENAKVPEDIKMQNTSQDKSIVESDKKANKNQALENQVPNLNKQQLDIVKALQTYKQKSVPELSAEVEIISSSYNLKPICFLEKKVESDLFHYPCNKSDMAATESTSKVIVEYSSPLLHLQCYRLNPYFQSRSQKKLTSTSYVHKIDPKRQMCKFDLLGTCNDDNCTWLHSKTYQVTMEETLIDLLSYAPEVAGVLESDTIETIQKKLDHYVSALKQTHHVSEEELCNIVLNTVNKYLNNGPPHFATFERRKYNFLRNVKTNSKDDKFLESIKSRKGNLPRFVQQDYDPDTVVSENDLRYFQCENGKTERLEEVVSENPHSIDLWLKLAYQQLYKEKESEESNLDHALNVLSRALENNQSNAELWQHYLSLYAKHPASDDLEVLCQQAVQFCPHYDVWWKYLQLVEGCNTKEKIAGAILEFLVEKGLEMDKDMLSHNVLEVVLFQVMLHIHRGQHRKAADYLLKCIKNGGSKHSCSENIQSHSVESNNLPAADCSSACAISSSVYPVSENGQYLQLEDGNKHTHTAFDLLTQKDRCFGWLCYIYLMGFRSLPSSIFESGHCGLGHVVNKEPFLIPWNLVSNSSLPNLCNILRESIINCSRDDPNCNINHIFPLYWNQISLELHQNRFETVLEMCQNLVKVLPSDPKVWILLIRLYSESSVSKCVQNIFEDAILNLGYRPYLCYAVANCAKKNDNCEEALLVLEKCIRNYYHDDDNDDDKDAHDNIRYMYCNLLGCDHLEASLKKYQEKYVEKPSISQDDLLYMWLNYLLWLECKNESPSQIMAYFETALSWAKSATASTTLWWEYLSYAGSQVFLSTDKTECFRSFTSLVRRCLITVPVRKTMQYHPSKTWADYTFHNVIINYYCDYLLCPSEQALACMSFLSLLPGNIQLLKRTVRSFFKANEKSNALSLLKKSLNRKVTDTSVWKMAIHLTYEEEDHQEIHRMFDHALEALPYSVSLWRDFLLYELSENHTNHVQQALSVNKKFQIHSLQDFIESIIS